MKTILFTLCFTISMMAMGNANLFGEDVSQIESKVPELSAFHEVIFPIWHEYYPEKKYTELRQIVKTVQDGAQKIASAKLPGILRDKTSKWQTGVDEFKKAVDQFANAAAGQSDQALLDGAENMHAKFEMLVRIIRPVLKEVDEFHKILYTVYHTALPNNDIPAISKAAADLQTKALAIVAVTLPKRLENRAAEYKKAAASLLTDVNILAEYCKQGKEKEIKLAVETMHSAYQDVEKVFN